MKPRTLMLVGMVLWLVLVGLVHAGTVTYVYTDPQGTPLAEADAHGNITARFDYSPYGSIALGTAPNGPGYTGHVNDPETGLIYMQQRYDSPSEGRFLSPDPVGVSPGDVFSFNRYAYANDNPVRFTDPDGRQSVGEMIDSAAQGCGAVSCAGYAVLHAAWSMTGAEPLSQVADKGWSNVSTGDKIGAVVAVAAALPPIKIVGEIAPIAKEALPAIKAGSAGGETAGKVFSQAVKDAAHAENPGSVCVYCRMEGTGTQVDHAIPKARGGNATVDNAQLACPHCNASKGARDVPVNPPPGYRGEWPPPHWNKQP